MANSLKRQRRLGDEEAIPGFCAQSKARGVFGGVEVGVLALFQTKVRGVFGDVKARVIALIRRSKKRFAAVAVACTSGGTIGACGGSAIFPAATHASTWRSRCGVCCDGVAG